MSFGERDKGHNFGYDFFLHVGNGLSKSRSSMKAGKGRREEKKGSVTSRKIKAVEELKHNCLSSAVNNSYIIRIMKTQDGLKKKER